ncbi:DUF349 domain-containing protein [Mangrovivirga sp. M17]|uniref:DUF349 domain-containing protein n=1 Tax=Mangrovivirga halotolerans TaxID=2993936 RepID=A0ABT3RU43_9BACT|nr:DUF349 domain-containing protein [Mangrovivirga halotolerans]MCX2745298.1 DUF349 domain-containing protein [Mangrovivirga halotolerans]
MTDKEKNELAGEDSKQENPVNETQESPLETKAEDQKEEEKEIPESEEKQKEEPVSESKKEETDSSASDQPENSDDQDEDDDHDDDHEEEDDDHEEEIDYHNLSKEELLKVVKDLSAIDNMAKIGRVLKEVVPIYEEYKDKERQEALDKFIEEGGEEDGFDYKYDKVTEEFDATVQLLKDRRSKHYRSQKEQKQKNLDKKNEILERLREIVDSEETNVSINKLKEIQTEWKEVGPVPGGSAKSLWANYNALIDRFYDNRSIYFELKELDRKRNQTLKEDLIKRAEALETVEILKDAIAELNELHEEYKHVGPVPKEVQEDLWTRFKAASDKVYMRRKDYVEQLKKDLSENLEKKLALVEKVKPFAEFSSDRINDWNAKTKEILAIQKEWDSIGGMPRNKAKEVNKEFWGSFKSFFNSKGKFFKELEKERKENLKLKEDLVTRAEELKDSTDWQQTAAEMKKLQAEWKKVGPVPQKVREEVFKKFKAACDTFFQNRREQNKQFDQNYEKNLEAKEKVISEIHDMREKDLNDIDKLEDKMDDFFEIGFVPKKDIKATLDKFIHAIDQYLDESTEIDSEEAARVKMVARFGNMKGDKAERKMVRKEGAIRRQISKLQDDIVNWKNNMSFFASSKTADKLLKDFEDKIEQAEEKIIELKEQLRVLQDLENEANPD